VQVLNVFIHVSAWQKNIRSFTVTAMSVYATTLAPRHDAEGLTCAEAAELLGVPPAALERWARQLAFPTGSGAGADTRFKRSEIEALRDALMRSHSVEGAVRAARERTPG
jgi:Helix-turn-helix domain